MKPLRTERGIRTARKLRRDLTDAEHKVWYHLRSSRLNGWKFRRQVPLGSYVVDFLCAESSLIVELDGGQHAEQEAYDQARTEWLQGQGYRVLRFWNSDVMTNLGEVLQAIADALAPSP